MAEGDEGLSELGTISSRDDITQNELKKVEEERPKAEAATAAEAASKKAEEKRLKDIIIHNLLLKLRDYVNISCYSHVDIIDFKKTIEAIVSQANLGDFIFGDKTLSEINNLISKMVIKLNTIQKNNILEFGLHDSIKLFSNDSSIERCLGVRIFLEIIYHLVSKINDPNDTFINFFKVNNICYPLPDSISWASVTYGESLLKSRQSCRTSKNPTMGRIYTNPISGGSKSRCKPARKTRRRRTRKSKAKSKAKSKTHRRIRHSRVRKHKKNLYTRRR